MTKNRIKCGFVVFLAVLMLGSVLTSCVFGVEVIPGEPEWIEVSIGFLGEATLSGQVSSASLTTYYIPHNDARQTTSCTVQVEEGEEGNEFVEFAWSAVDSLTYMYSCTVRVQVGGAALSSDVPYPVTLSSSIRDELAPYLLESEFVAMNDAIQRKAEQVASGSSGEFDVASRVCAWVNSIMTYNTSFTDSIVPSDIVFATQQGVCDEYAHLSIAMLRSLGIPARYVAGYAYGGSGRSKSFGPHGWIEVYFPGTGWIPFDPTYGQYGYVDPSHIKFYHSTDEGFNVQRTEYNYPSTTARPTILWDENEPQITVTGQGPTFKPFDVTIERGNSSSIHFGEQVLVGAHFENVWNSAICQKAMIAYKTDFLRPSQNLRLEYGSEEERVCAFPGDVQTIEWVLGRGAPNYMFTVRAYAGQEEFEEASISIHDKPVRGTLSAVVDKSRYTEGELILATVSASKAQGVSAAGTVTVRELSTGIVKEEELASGEDTTFEFEIQAHESIAFYSEELFAFAKPELQVTSKSAAFDAKLHVPTQVISGRTFLVNVSVTSANSTSMLASVEFLGTQVSGSVSGSRLFIFNTSLHDSGTQTLKSIVRTPYGSLTLSRAIEVFDPPQLFVKFVQKAYLGESEPLVQNISTTSGELLSATLKTGWDDGAEYMDPLADITIPKEDNVCGVHSLSVSAFVRDATNRTAVHTESSSIMIECGFLQNIIRTITKFISSLFGR